MKVVKIAIKVLVVVLVLAVAAALTLPLWFGPVVKTVANASVPSFVKTDFRLGHLSLNPYTARFELGGMNLGNPRGYAVNDAVRVGSVIFDADTFSLMSDVIHIEEITLKDLFVSVVNGGENHVLNFTQIQYNIAGGKEKYEAAQSAKEANAGAKADTAQAKESGAKKPSKRIVIDRLEVSGLTLQLSILPLRIPSVVLTDIGRKSGGATLDEAWQQIVEGVMKAAGMTGDQLKVLGNITGGAAKKANAAVNNATSRTAAAVGDVTKKVSATAGKATETVSSTVGAATDATTGVVNGGAKSVGDSAKAVGEGAKKAMESLKSLW